MNQNNPEKTSSAKTSKPFSQIQARIVTIACLCIGFAIIAVIGGWAVTGTLTDWETVVGGFILMALLAGLATLARRDRPALSAWLLAGLLFLIVSADLFYYGLGSPSPIAFLLPVILLACTVGLKPGLAAASLAVILIFGVAWASLNGLLTVAIPVDESHLSYNAPVISVILLFCAGLTGYTVDAYRRHIQKM